MFSVGVFDGDSVGLSVGDSVGNLVGFGESCAVGFAVGDCVGVAVRTFVGSAVSNFLVGTAVGTVCVGAVVRTTVGEAVEGLEDEDEGLPSGPLGTVFDVLFANCSRLSKMEENTGGVVAGEGSASMDDVALSSTISVRLLSNVASDESSLVVFEASVCTAVGIEDGNETVGSMLGDFVAGDNVGCSVGMLSNGATRLATTARSIDSPW